MSTLATFDQLRAKHEAAEARAVAQGLVRVELDGGKLTGLVGLIEPLMWALQALKAPRERTDVSLWTTPELAGLLPALVHAQFVWPLQSHAEIIKMIGLDGLREYHAAWALDAPETDLAELLESLATTYSRESVWSGGYQPKQVRRR